MRAATVVSADSDVSTSVDVRPSAPSAKLPLPTSRPSRSVAVQKTQLLRSSPCSRPADRAAPSGEEQPHNQVFRCRPRTFTAGPSSCQGSSCVQQSTCVEASAFRYGICTFGCRACCTQPEDIVLSNPETPGLLRRDGQPIVLSCTSGEVVHPEDAGIFVVRPRD